jgi:hypothetical protein
VHVRFGEEKRICASYSTPIAVWEIEAANHHPIHDGLDIPALLILRLPRQTFSRQVWLQSSRQDGDAIP